jgi:hypothetical protein
MNGKWSKPPLWLIWVMWLALPITALEYQQNWDSLPVRMAVHFDANWNPNGFTSREGAEHLGLGVLATMLILFTIGAFAVRALRPKAAWPQLVIFYAVLGLVWYGNHSVIAFNLKSSSPHVEVMRASFPIFRYGVVDGELKDNTVLRLRR